MTTETDESGLSFSRVMAVHTRAAGDEKDLLNRAKARALDPTIFDEFPPFFFGGEISSERWDAYDTRMGLSSLKNYARDAMAGFAFLRNHNNREDPTGGTLRGVFTAGAGDEPSITYADLYMITDPQSLDYIAKIRSGIVKDLSIGFYGGQWICSICGRDMEQWMSRDGCPHLLGMTYTPTDQAGSQKGQPEVARATIENAHCAEVSGVYDGATPGAMITKARSLAAEGLLNERQRETVQVRYHIRLPASARAFAGATPGEEEPVTGPEKSTEGTPDPLAEVRAAAAGFVEHGIEQRDSPAEMMRAAQAEMARLRPLAGDGRAYREDLVNEALAEGVRAHGADFAQDQYKPMLVNAPLATIKRMRDDWKTLGDKTFAGGRQTKESDEPEAKPNPRDLPDHAFRS